MEERMRPVKYVVNIILHKFFNEVMRESSLRVQILDCRGALWLRRNITSWLDERALMVLLLGTGITRAVRLRPEALFAPPSAPGARCREFHGAAFDWTSSIRHVVTR
jgi:hypothetical protein